MSDALFVFHGHFYQPPRENPWTGLVAREPGASPFHDWNERIDDECYRPNAYGRIVDDEHRVAEVVNNYEHMSFNVGPTLVAWLREHDPQTLRRMVEADATTADRHAGHGSAIAQAYNHVILPLADARDRATQIRWGLAVFRHDFGREAEAMWLPETAASAEVLDDLIDHGMRFVILEPGQAGRVRPVGGGRWRRAHEADIDPSRPCLYRHRTDPARTLLVFFYDGALAHEISFGDALGSSARFTERVVEARGRREDGPLIHAAADGETAGHHNAWGDRVLAHALTRALGENGLRVTHYAALLDEVEPRLEVEPDPGPDGEGTSWSCAHGVGRWIRDCGCSIAHTPGWNQQWRAGLRAALDLLRDRARPWFEEEAGRVFDDPWAARDDYVTIVLEPTDARREEFLAAHVRPGTDPEAARRGLELLEMQHQLMLQYTSCGWFFDDISGLEGRQVLRYAARALEAWHELGGTPPEEEFLERLARARSNVAGDGATIFREIRERDALDRDRLAGLFLLRADASGEDAGRCGHWGFRIRGRRRIESESVLLHAGTVELCEAPTGRRTEAEVVLRQTGDFDLEARLRPPGSDERFEATCARLGDVLVGGREHAALEEEFGPVAWRTADVLGDGARELLHPALADGFARLREEVSALVERHESLLSAGLGTDDTGLLREFSQRSREATFSGRLRELLEGSGDAAALAAEIAASRVAPAALRPVVEAFVGEAIRDGRSEEALRAIGIGAELEIPLYLHRAQEDWLEHAPVARDREAALRLGETLGFAPEFCGRALGGAPSRTGGSGA